MLPCKRIGIDTTWRCQWRCKACFYLRDPRFHKSVDVPLCEIKDKINAGKAGGCNHVVFVGYGEPSLDPRTPEIIDYSHLLGMKTSMITNGATGLDRFKGYFAQGMDHLHISSHGLDGTLDEIAESKGAFAKQTELKTWMRSVDWPFRINVTLQQRNYRELPDLVEYEYGMGVYHFVILGFLPHYQWNEHVREVAVHPAELRPYIEDAAEMLLARDTLFTIRYHPFCHLSPKYWKYVVNARYVFFDPMEWNYTLQANDTEALWKASVLCGESVACASPCNKCLAYPHCGGWNRVYAAAYDGADLRPIRDIPDEYKDMWKKRGGLHDLNPVNQLSGTLRDVG